MAMNEPLNLPNIASLTAEQLAVALNLPSAQTVGKLARSRKIPVIKIGYRTHRYDLDRVKAALARLEQRAIA